MKGKSKSTALKIWTASTLVALIVSTGTANARGGGHGGGGHGGGGHAASGGHPGPSGHSASPYNSRNTGPLSWGNHGNLTHHYYGGRRLGYGWGYGGGYGGYGYGYRGYGYGSNNNYGEPYMSSRDAWNQSEDRRRENLPTSAFIHEYHWPSGSGTASSSSMPPGHPGSFGALQPTN